MQSFNVSLLLERTVRDRAEGGIVFLDRRGRREQRVTWPEWRERARAGARRLAAQGVEPGRPVLLALGTSPELLETWLACVLHGALPVIAAPPQGAGAGRRETDKLIASARSLDPALIVAGEAVGQALAGDGAGALGPMLTPAQFRGLPELAGAEARGLQALPEELAFLQLTSGSTGQPRAVAISHGNVLHQVRANDLAIGAPSGRPASEGLDAVVSWLPLHHDMGLVGCFLFALATGVDLCLLAPRTFLARPMVWLNCLSSFGRTIAPAPNFAYQTCVDRHDAAALGDVQLGGWRHALMGAEMVRPETVAEFQSIYAERGFDPQAVLSCYGLAEGTLSVTFDQAGRGLRTRRRPAGDAQGVTDLAGGDVVCSGAPIEGTRLSIRRPDGSEADGIGEVWAKGPSVFQGYYADEAATAETLQDGWMRTGDLGFLHDGELYLTGRAKDVLILKGQNWMPHELEWCAESVTGGGGSFRSAAFSVVLEEGEAAVLLIEAEPMESTDLEAAAREVRVRIGRELGLPLADVRFVRRGSLPKTSSGKVQRSRAKEIYASGDLTPYELSAAASLPK